MQAATIETTRAETARRAGYELDLKAVTDITAAQKAATAGQRAYNDAIAAGQLESDARARQAEASALSLAQARQQLSEAGRQQTLATERQIAQAQLEYDLVGKSAGEVARLRTEFDLLAQAKDAARSAGFDEAQVHLTDEMRRQAAEVGRLTDATQRLNFERDLLFDRQQATRSPEDQRIAEQLRSIGVEFDSVQGRADAAQLRLNERLHQTNDAFYEMRDAGKEAFLDLIESIGSGDDALKTITQTLAGFGRQFASVGLDKIMDTVFGKGGSASTSGGGVLAALSGLTGGASRGGGTSTVSMAPLNVPVPTPAARATTAALVQTVTQNVSSNLLTSMLGAGKNRSHITGMNKEFASALTNMFEAAPQAVKASLTINSGFRSVARQAELFDAALKKYGSVSAARKWVAPPGNSQHNHGNAADLGYGSVSAREWVHNNAGKYGLAFPLSNENWHIELASARGGGSARSVATEQKTLAKGVSQGLEDYQRKIGTPESYSAGRFDASAPSGGTTIGSKLQNLLKSPFGQGAMNALGAFGAGVSGGPLSGALTGGLGAIGMGLGPLGIAAGVAGGVLGGLAKNLFNKKEREAKHREQAAAWDAMQGDYLAWQKQSKTSMPTSGLSDYFATDIANFDKFREAGGAAWKYGKNNSSQSFIDVGTAMFGQHHRIRDAFRETIDPTIEMLKKGLGIDSPLADGRNQIYKLGQQLLQVIDDTTEALSYRPDEQGRRVKEVTDAAIEQVLKSMDVVEPMSDVATELQRLDGGFLGAKKVLMDLGLTADDAAARLEGKLPAAIKALGESWEQDFQSRINELSNVGYLNDVTSLLKERDTGLSDAALLGKDPAVVTKWFTLAAQSIVDGSELTGDAFAELVKAFPQLTGVVHAFTGATKTATQIAEEAQQAALSAFEASKAQLQTVYQTMLSYRDGIASFRDKLQLGDTATLSQADQVAEAQRIYNETLAKANAGDKEAMSSLTGAAGDLLSKAKDYFKTSPEYVAIFNSVSASLKAAEGKATSQLTTMEKQAAFLKDIAGSNLNIEKALSDFLKSQKAVNDNRNWGLNPERNKAMVKAASAAGYDYTGAFGSGGWNSWIASMKPSDQAILRAIEQRYAGMNYDTGGYTGAGGRKEVAGVVHRGEVVWNQDDVARGGGVARVDAMRLGLVRDPYPQTAVISRQAANLDRPDAFASRGDVRDLAARLDRIADILGDGFGGTIEATNRVSSAAQQSAYASRRAAIKSGKAA